MEKKFTVSSPESYVKRFLSFFETDGSLGTARAALFATAIAAFFAYHLLIIYGNGNADAVNEGLVMYTGADWALACGRWFVRYFNRCSGNIVLPALWTGGYMLCSFVSTMLLAKLWGIKSKLSVCLTAVMLAVNCTVIEQSLLQYMFLMWGMSNVLGVLFVYLSCRGAGKWQRYFWAPVCMALAFSMYQAVVGLISLCFCITLILALADGRGVRDMLRQVLSFAVSCAIGALLYFAVLKLELLRYGVGESARVAEFSLSAIISSLPGAAYNAYEMFFGYFMERILWRKYMYALLAVFGLAYFAGCMAALLRQRQYGAVVCAVLLAVLIPAFANIAKLLFPYSTLVTIMEYQNNFVFPFLFALTERAKPRFPSLHNLSRICILLLTAALCWTYQVSANATYKAYELSYKHLYFETSSMLNEIYAMPEYTPGDTIAFAGAVSDEALRSALPIYRYAYGMYDNLAFWGNGIGPSQNQYLMCYFGVDAGAFDYKAFTAATRSDEFKAMGVYPADNSIREFDGMMIVKLPDPA